MTARDERGVEKDAGLVAEPAHAPVVHHGDCLAVMRNLPDASVDAIVTDPPYGLGFLGHRWDDLPPGEDWARECLRVLKPGGHLLAFGGTRTWHKIATAIEDAGFELRDSIAWLYGTGFPKSRGVLKPAFEPIVVARKGRTGVLSIDACRIEVTVEDAAAMERANSPGSGRFRAVRTESGAFGRSKPSAPLDTSLGRWPANVTLDASQAVEIGDSARYFYVAKASKSERPKVGGITHPTVKPLALMRWLVRLATPPAGTVLDTFAGSGTTVAMETWLIARAEAVAEQGGGQS